MNPFTILRIWLKNFGKYLVRSFAPDQLHHPNDWLEVYRIVYQSLSSDQIVRNLSRSKLQKYFELREIIKLHLAPLYRGRDSQDQSPWYLIAMSEDLYRLSKELLTDPTIESLYTFQISEWLNLREIVEREITECEDSESQQFCYLVCLKAKIILHLPDLKKKREIGFVYQYPIKLSKGLFDLGLELLNERSERVHQLNKLVR